MSLIYILVIAVNIITCFGDRIRKDSLGKAGLHFKFKFWLR